MKHLVFYDGQCGLCDHTVQFILKRDKKEEFAFAPLQGETANEFLSQLPSQYRELDSVILVENYQTPNKTIHIQSKAILRIFWLIGGIWKALGWMYFLPAILFDWGYRLVASNRHRLFSQDACELPDPKFRGRFLK